MNTRSVEAARSSPFFSALAVQTRVIGALILRELHTRYGRDNIGYLWMIGEPMLLASVIGLMHFANSHSATLKGDLHPVPFGVLGYVTFIVFRGIVNRSVGGMDANAPLLYHRQVTPLDISLARAVLEVAAVFLTFVILMGLLVLAGMANLPARPLSLIGAWALMFWHSLAQSLIISAISYENRTVERLVHPYTYFMIGLSCAFFQVSWIPRPFRDVLTYIPVTSIMELARYGWFRSANDDYVFLLYTIGWTLALTWLGLVLLNQMRNRIHLS